ncbi:comm domain containing protein [Anaeramoeba flamelloides]|uniref:Comm domain containing protein n=1 Tax=Anaeramoeba flamelloides TaxID=1746091 RepID=A0AAV8AHK4_9EUKA|nr:comm domain containing protein [Anaeramoeba flamelloides]KAJ6249531.1 comm domain containing protein [Anaeramoeba flamelloides]
MSNKKKSLFGNTTQFKSAIELINSIEEDEQFSRVILRIIKRSIEGVQLFSEKEQTQLLSALSLNNESLQTILAASNFIFQQSAYFGINSESLAHQLKSSGMETNKIKIFVNAWKQGRSEYTKQLMEKSIAPRSLQEINWSLHLQSSNKNTGRDKTPISFFEFQLKDPDTVNEEKKKDNFIVEFNHQQLFRLYEKFERLQEQLDQLI